MDHSEVPQGHIPVLDFPSPELPPPIPLRRWFKFSIEDCNRVRQLIQTKMGKHQASDDTGETNTHNILSEEACLRLGRWYLCFCCLCVLMIRSDGFGLGRL